jgi:hypothetical protein
VVATATSRSIVATWCIIECIERNGIITGYAVEFQEQGGARTTEVVVVERFNIDGLTPARNYTFRVAGVSINGTGPFTNYIFITTNEEGMACIWN